MGWFVKSKSLIFRIILPVEQESNSHVASIHGSLSLGVMTTVLVNSKYSITAMIKMFNSSWSGVDLISLHMYLYMKRNSITHIHSRCDQEFKSDDLPWTLKKHISVILIRNVDSTGLFFLLDSAFQLGLTK